MSIYPQQHKTGNVGIRNKKWKNIYSVNINAESGSFSNASISDISIDTGSISHLTTISSSNQYISGSNLVATNGTFEEIKATTISGSSQLNINNNNLFVSGGSVGIGTNGLEGAVLAIDKTLGSSESGKLITLGDISSNRHSNINYYNAGSDNNSYLGFSGKGNSSNQLILTGAGNVGLGITNPSDELEVVGVAKATTFDCTGTYQMDNADIINSSKQQTGDFKTRSYLVFGRGATITSDHYLGGPGCMNDNSYRGEYVIPYDSILTSVALSVQTAFTFLTSGDQVVVHVQRATYPDGSFGAGVNFNTSLVYPSCEVHLSGMKSFC